MKMKKILAFLLVTSMATSLLASCTSGGSDTSNTDSSDSSTSSEATIHVASWNNAADNLSEIAEEFNKLGKGEVIIDYADGDYTKLKPALQSGTGAPDIFQTQNRDIPAFYNSYGLDAFVDITDIIEADADKWVSFALETCMAEDGKYYAIPWDIGPVGLYYRTDIYEDAGIDVSAIETYDDYMAAGKKLQEINPEYYIEAYNYNGSTSTDEFLIYLNQLGGQFYDSEGNVNFASEEMLKATELVQEMISEGLAMDIPNAWDDRITAINANKLVSFTFPAWYMGTLKNSASELSGKWGVAQMPAFEAGGNRYANAGGSILAISSQTENVELAKEFLVYSMKEDAGNDVNMKYGEFPSYTPAYETEYFKSTDEYFGGLAVGTIFSELTGAPSQTWGPYFTDVIESIKTGAGNILINNQDPQTAWEAASKEAQNKIDLR